LLCYVSQVNEVIRLSKENLRVAVVGAGKMGLVHASILSTFPNVELKAICDKSSLIRKFLSKVVGKERVFAEVDLLRGLNIDIVFVTTPIPSHYYIIKELCSWPKPPNIFVEKTLTSNFERSIELCDLAKNSGITNMVGYMKRFAVTFQKANELMHAEAIGKVASFRAHAFSSDFFGVDKSSKMGSGRGGVLSDLGSHVIDLAVWFFGDFEVNSVKKVLETDVQDGVGFTVENNEHLKGEFDVSWSKEGYHVPEFELFIQGSEGWIKVDDDMVKLEMRSGKSKSWHRHDLLDNVGFLLGAPEYYREDDYFMKCVLGKEKILIDFSEASKVDKIIGKVLERI
jgi:predicted dehydrogenase